MKTHNAFLLLFAATLGASAFCQSPTANRDLQDVTAVSTPAPKYPYELRRVGVEGAVLVSFTITAKGKIADVVAVKSTDRAFEDSALKAVKSWKFTPAMKDGRAVDRPTLQVITFTMNEKKTETPIAELIATMRPRRSSKIVESLDSCFCRSGKTFNECHGLDEFPFVASGK